MTRKLLLAAASGAAMFAAAPAMAQTTQVPMKVLVDLELADICDVNTGANAEQTRISFGRIDPDGLQSDVIGSNSASLGGVGLTITCNQVIPSASFRIGKGGQDNGEVRSLIRNGGDELIAYELFLGDSVSGPSLAPDREVTVNGTVAGGITTFTIPITGRIAFAEIAGSGPTPTPKPTGTYSDAANGVLIF